MTTREPPKTEIIPVTEEGSILTRRDDLAANVRDFISQAEAHNTFRARRADWRVFESWCAAARVVALPATSETVAAFLADQASASNKAAATVVRYARSIAAVHKLSKLPPPTDHEAVRLVLRGIKRSKGLRQEHKEALTAELLMRGLPDDKSSRTQDIRDRALLLVGLASGMRRSELCSIDVDDLRTTPKGIEIELRRSKTDQEGHGRPIAIPEYVDDYHPYCPVKALRGWLAVAGHTSGAVFRGLKCNGEIRDGRMSDRAVCDAVKRAAARAGLDVEKFGAHSLRAGYVTTAREEGLDWGSIMEQTGHKRLETVKLYSRYAPEAHEATRVADVFRDSFRRTIPTLSEALGALKVPPEVVDRIVRAVAEQVVVMKVVEMPTASKEVRSEAILVVLGGAQKIVLNLQAGRSVLLAPPGKFGFLLVPTRRAKEWFR